MLGYQGTEKLGDNQHMSSNWLPQPNSWRPTMDSAVGMPLAQPHGLEHNTAQSIPPQPFAFTGVIYPPYAGTSQMGNMLPTSNGISQSNGYPIQPSGYGGMGSYGGAYSMGYGLPNDLKQERKTHQNQDIPSPSKTYTDLSQNQGHPSNLDKVANRKVNNCASYPFEKISMGSDKTDSDSDHSTPSTFSSINLKENVGSPFSDLSREDTPTSSELNWMPCEDWKPHALQQQAPNNAAYDRGINQGGYQDYDMSASGHMNLQTRKTAKPKATRMIGDMEIPKRDRLSYTRYQLELMVGIYKEVDYPNKVQKHLIAKRVGISKDQVKIWFQNRRRRELIAKQHPDSADARRKQAKDEEEELRRVNPVVTQDIIDCVVKELQAHEEVATGKQKMKRKPAVSANITEAKSEAKHNNHIISDYIPNGQTFQSSHGQYAHNLSVPNTYLDSDHTSNGGFEINTNIANPPNKVSLNRTPIKTPPPNDKQVQRKRPADEPSVKSSIPRTPDKSYTVYVPNSKKQKQNEEEYEKSQKDGATNKTKPGFCPPNMVAPRGGELNKALLGLIESSVTSAPSTYSTTAPSASRTTSVSSDCSVGSSPRKPCMSSRAFTGQSPDPKAYLGNARHHPRNVKTEPEEPAKSPLNYSTADSNGVSPKQLYFGSPESDGSAIRQISPVADTYNNHLSIDVPEIKSGLGNTKHHLLNQGNGGVGQVAHAAANGYDSGLLMVSPLARSKSISPPFVSQSSVQPGVLPYMGYTTAAPWMHPATSIQPQMAYNNITRSEQHIV
ncbi:unnamed protein product [Owenia fusiformis]|uniref:Homeobox domain-containing protein n=1 Tax=Owenia fusiformis TaxID=6347 RepID=A0A8S4PD62_OWEFU|nr:unnamed protein product [Owenia fusiformis]